MINVTVVLPDGKRGKVKIEPNASIGEVKRTIISDLKALGLDKPERYVLALAVNASRENDTPVGQLQLKDEDYIYILSLIVGKPAEVDPTRFK